MMMPYQGNREWPGETISAGQSIGWWELVDDITEYNRENEKLGMRAVINSGQGFAYFELQKANEIKLVLKGEYHWQAIERCPLEFFVMRGYFATDGQWVTRYLKAFVIGLPSPFNWKPCAEPEEYAHATPGMTSMVIAENEPPHSIIAIRQKALDKNIRENGNNARHSGGSG